MAQTNAKEAKTEKEQIALREKERAVTTAALVVDNKFINALANQLKEKEQYGLTFPADYNVTNALTGAYLIIKDTLTKDKKPVLEVCTQESIANTLMDMATMGLSMQKKQCYPVAYGNKLQCQVSYHGNKAMAHRYGAKTINAEVIYEGDEFEYHIEDGVKVLDKHIQSFENIDTDKIVGAYCVITMYDGSKLMEVMNINQIKTAWRKGYGYKPDSGTHKEFTDMMAKKTVTSRACKQIVQQYGDVFTVDATEKVEKESEADVTVENLKYDVETKANQIEFEDADVIDVDEPEFVDDLENPE